MFARVTIVFLFASVTFGRPPTSSGKSGKYSCDCAPVSSNDGVRTLQCHCTEKSDAGSLASIDAPGNAANKPGATQIIEIATTPGAGNGNHSAGNSTTAAPEVTAHPTSVNSTVTGHAGNNATTPSEPLEGASNTSGHNNTASVGGESAIATESNKTETAALVSGASPAKDESPSKAPVIGNTWTYVACMKRDANAANSVKPKSDWLKTAGGKDEKVTGKWERVACVGGSKYVFRTDAKQYKSALDACKKLGHDIAQPGDHSFSGYYGFEVEDTVQEYFSWPTMRTWNRVKAEPVTECTMYGVEGGTGSSFGDASTSILCIKKGDSKSSKKPSNTWLNNSNGKSVTIRGTWNQKTSCSHGKIQPFIVLRDDYNSVLDQCKKQGYDIAQPADNSLSSWYPFQVARDLQEYYRSERAGLLSNNYFLESIKPIDKC